MAIQIRPLGILTDFKVRGELNTYRTLFSIVNLWQRIVVASALQAICTTCTAPLIALCRIAICSHSYYRKLHAATWDRQRLSLAPCNKKYLARSISLTSDCVFTVTNFQPLPI